jgi:hypothetical protein
MSSQFKAKKHAVARTLLVAMKEGNAGRGRRIGNVQWLMVNVELSGLARRTTVRGPKFEVSGTPNPNLRPLAFGLRASPLSLEWGRARASLSADKTSYPPAQACATLSAVSTSCVVYLVHLVFLVFLVCFAVWTRETKQTK